MDTKVARLTRLRLSRKGFKPGGRGTKVSFRLSEAATVRFTVERRKGGRRVRGRCRKPTRKNRLRRKCNLRIKGSFRKRGRKLKPGRYYLVATTTDSVGNTSKPKRAKFRIRG